MTNKTGRTRFQHYLLILNPDSQHHGMHKFSPVPYDSSYGERFKSASEQLAEWLIDWYRSAYYCPDDIPLKLFAWRNGWKELDVKMHWPRPGYPEDWPNDWGTVYGSVNYKNRQCCEFSFAIDGRA